MGTIKNVVLMCFALLVVQNSYAQCRSGDCYDGLGTYVHPSGAKYIGQFRKGKMHGFGTVYFTNGNVYAGDWKANHREGHGNLTFRTGGYYDGQFIHNHKDGNGKWEYANGDIYVGEFKKDKRNGQGTYSYKSGDKYVGEFKEGEFHGFGKMYYSDGARYEGNWASNKKNGVGFYLNIEGKKVDGNWVNGKRSENIVSATVPNTGSETQVNDASNYQDCNSSYCDNTQGVFLYSDGAKWVGSFKNGIPNGKGICYYANGDRYEGLWDQHAPHDLGIMHYIKGDVIGAIWDHGRIVKRVRATDGDISKGKIQVKEDKEIRIWAVVVGISTYTHMQSLKFTDDDAYQIFGFLKSPEGGAIPDNQIRVLIDEKGTQQNIINSMREMFLQADENDVIVFYYSGHGIDGSFVPSDYDGYNNLLHHKDVRAIMRESKAKHKILYADACHSGSMNALASKGAYYKQLDAFYNEFESTDGGIALLMSSKAQEFSLEDHGLRQGIFSHYLIRGLKGEADVNQNKIVTIQELFNFVNARVKGYTLSAQNPTLTGSYDINMPVAFVRK